MSIEEAQEVYRAAWTSYLMCRDPKDKKEIEQVMDAAQPFCVESGRPGPEWEAFIDTLPGFRDFWDGFATKGRKIAREMKNRC
jgi:hypothetical protein